MAYPYPSAEGATSSSSLHNPTHGVFRGDISRKASEGDSDVLDAFRKKIEEDEAYINFFQDRIQLEEQYISGLNKLYSRTLAMDTLHEKGPRKGTKPTVRRAWAEIRDYTQREAQSREAMVGAVKEDVLKELVKMRDTQARIRQGLKENLRTSNEQYEDHLKGTLNKLKRSYWSKCQADFKRQEHAIAMQAKLLSQPTSPNQQAVDMPSNLNAISPPTFTGPLPPLSNPAMQPPSSETSPSKGRHRAGSASIALGQDKTKDVFNDIAQQSKRGFNAFMQKLGGDRDREREREDGGFVVVGSPEGEGSTGLQRRGTLQGVGMKGASARQIGQLKSKRDAEEADKAYRAGVFHLESLRLRREKVQQSALQNLDSFSDDLNKQIKLAMERYIDTMHGTGATIAQSTEVARHAIESINLDQDMSIWRSRINTSIGNQSIEPVPYHNFYVGECRSLIFGVSLTDYDFTRPQGTQTGEPPIIVEKGIAVVDRRGLNAEGIYRVSGRKTGVQQMVQDIERDETRFQFSDTEDDVFSVAGVLKQYLRELPDPVFPLPHAERVKHTKERETHIHSNFSALRGRLRRLPPIHQTTFRALIEHLGRVNSHSSKNKMDAKNLAVIFNSVIFGPDQLPTDGNVLTMTLEKDTVLEDLITYSDLLFSEISEPQAPSLLPPGSGLSRTGVISYHPVQDGPHPGSARTRVQIVNADTTAISASLNQPRSSAVHVEEPGQIASGSGAVITVDPPLSPVTSMPMRSFTEDDQLELLFDPGLIPASMREGLQEDYHVRPLASDDLLRGHFALLSTLTTSPAVAPSLYTSIFEYLKSIQGIYYVVVFVHKPTDELIAAATLFVERKHIHAGGIAGHIEDVVVAPQCRGTGIGLRLVSGLKELGDLVGCYKTILDCREDRVGFYEKCGFVRRGIQMAHYASNLDNSPAFAPTSIPIKPAGSLRTQGSNLTLPELRSTSPLLPTDLPGVAAPMEVELASETHSQSSGSASHTYPNTNPFKTGGPEQASSAGNNTTGAVLKEDSSESALQRPAWADEGLGSTELAPLSATSGIAAYGQIGSRSASPLPPGAAPPAHDAEPTRSGTQ